MGPGQTATFDLSKIPDSFSVIQPEQAFFYYLYAYNSPQALPAWANSPAVSYPQGAPFMGPLVPGGVGFNDLTLIVDTVRRPHA